MTQKFYDDMACVYAKIQKRDEQISNLYQAVKNPNHSFNKTLRSLCQRLGIESSETHFFALIERIASLKEGAILQILKQAQKSNQEIQESKEFLLAYVQDFYHQKHLELLQEIHTQNFLTLFYRNLLFGVHTIGEAMSAFFTQWNRILIDKINIELKEKFKDEVFAKLIPTIDKEYQNGALITSDRSYSIPFLRGDKIEILPFCKAFPKEINAITQAINHTIQNLQNLSDDEFGAKEAYMAYFNALYVAFAESSVDMLVARWQEVDRKWMAIQTPFQIGHPLEYYEDNLRHCVAPEWDLRLSSPHYNLTQNTQNNVLSLFENLASYLRAPQDLIDFVRGAYKKVCFFIGTPMLYYGADLNGLFSAQVAPNDEGISSIYGKKIFAFPDRILKAAQAKPKMRLSYEVFSREFLEQARDILFNNEKLWHRIYDISTNGHELGHILWIQHNTQQQMNVSGEFKNIEEFKATAGGLVAYFEHPHPRDEFEALMSDTIRRAVGLMAWREQEEVLPYYCEGLIHLFGAFATHTLSFTPQKIPCLSVNKNNYVKLKEWYKQTYISLARHYIARKDAKDWLFLYIQKQDGAYLPRHKQALEFVEWYWNKYQKIGQETLET